MPVVDLSAYKPVPATLGDANQIANGIQAIQTAINGLDNNNFAAGKIFDLLKLMQNGAVDGDGLAYSSAANGGAGGWVPSTTRKLLASGLSGYPSDIAQLLRGDGSWAKGATLIAAAAPNSATISFTSIPQTFKALMIVHQLNYVSTPAQNLSLIVNNDTTLGRYAWTSLFGTGTAGSSTSGSDTRMVVGSVGSSTAALGAGVIFIPNYTAATANRSAIGFSFESTPVVIVAGGFYSQAAAWTRIDLTASTGSFTNGSIALLYGIGG